MHRHSSGQERTLRHPTRSAILLENKQKESGSALSSLPTKQSTAAPSNKITTSEGNTAAPAKRKRAKPTLAMDHEEATLHTQSMLEEYRRMIDGIGDKQKNAINFYTKGGYENINKLLRGQELKWNYFDYTREDRKLVLDRLTTSTKELDSLFEEHRKMFPPPTEPRKLYRYLSFNTEEEQQRYLTSLSAGTSFTDEGFISTTEDPSYIVGALGLAEKSQPYTVVLEIESKAGISLQGKEEHPGKVQNWEKERLLPRGSTFQVESEPQEKSYQINPSREMMVKNSSGGDMFLSLA